MVDSPDLVHAKNSYLHCNEVGSSSNPGHVVGCCGLVLDGGASHLGDGGSVAHLFFLHSPYLKGEVGGRTVRASLSYTVE